MSARTSKSLRESTGRDYGEWFDLLDQWGAPGRPYAEIRDWLTQEHQVSSWWAQKLIIEYEQDRGIRNPGARPDGTFTGGASKTIPASAELIFAAVTERQDEWLPSGSMEQRNATPPRRAGFDWEGGPSRVQITIETGTPGKSIVSVEHSRLPDAEAAERQKVFWRDHLGRLKELLDPSLRP